ncbi:MAG: glycoside hydrolase family 76 protein, partial [Altererythrobacter sp.]|nr:glycoside hydrolase family 76 protein [Altererythrobacter sp.]
GLEPVEHGWIDGATARTRLAPLFAETAETYLPVLLANASAVANGEAQFTTEICGSKWTQPTFPYHARCLADLRKNFSSLEGEAREAVAATLMTNGCEALTERVE